jgi:hypothetical protein
VPQWLVSLFVPFASHSYLKCKFASSIPIIVENTLRSPSYPFLSHDKSAVWGLLTLLTSNAPNPRTVGTPLPYQASDIALPNPRFVPHQTSSVSNGQNRKLEAGLRQRASLTQSRLESRGVAGVRALWPTLHCEAPIHIQSIFGRRVSGDSTQYAILILKPRRECSPQINSVRVACEWHVSKTKNYHVYIDGVTREHVNIKSPELYQPRATSCLKYVTSSHLPSSTATLCDATEQ